MPRSKPRWIGFAPRDLWLALDTFQRVLFLTRDTQENTADIKELREEVQSLSDEVKRLAFDMERLKEVNRHERETLILQLNNTLLQFEHRLPPDGR